MLRTVFFTHYQYTKEENHGWISGRVYFTNKYNPNKYFIWDFDNVSTYFSKHLETLFSSYLNKKVCIDFHETDRWFVIDSFEYVFDESVDGFVPVHQDRKPTRKDIEDIRDVEETLRMAYEPWLYK